MVMTSMMQMTSKFLASIFLNQNNMNVTLGEYSRYLNPGRLNELVNCSAKRLEKIDFDTIAVCGISGLLIGSPLAMVTKKTLLIVRKPDEPTRGRAMFAQLINDEAANNAGRSIIGAGKNQKILLLDDHIVTGTTLGYMVSNIEEHCTNAALVGLFLYAEHIIIPALLFTMSAAGGRYAIPRPNGERLKMPVFTLHSF